MSLLLGTVHAADTRIWTSRTGSTIEAELLNQDGTNATLLPANGKQVVLKIEDLSLADRQFMVEYGGADPKILISGELGQPEKDARIDSSTFKKLKDVNLVFDEKEVAKFDLLETEHFLIGTAGRLRPQGIAETAERMWHGMAFQHMNFRRDWGDKRMLILLAEDRDAYTALGKWYTKYLTGIGEDEPARQSALTWEKAGSTSIDLPDEIAKKHKVFSHATIYNVQQDDLFRKAMGPFLIHTMAKDLLAHQLGGVGYGGEGYLALLTGHGYFKELSLAGKSETQLLDLTGTTKDEFTEAKGFADGTSWSRTLKGLVKKGEVKTELEPMFQWKIEDLNPGRLVLMYSFACYMQSTPQRVNSFAAMVRRIESSKQIPAPIEIARLFGFESVEDLEADWTLFIKEGKFN